MMILFFKDVLSQPYVSNVIDRGHEKQITKLLIKHKIVFWSQPNGPQRSPDFRVKMTKKKFLDIELKSSKEYSPLFNGGLPKKNTVYIFCSKKYDETTIFFGRDIISDRKRRRYDLLIAELREVLIKHQAKPGWVDKNRGFDFYIRNMFIQRGGGARKDYFRHPDRELVETNVFRHLSSDYL